MTVGHEGFWTTIAQLVAIGGAAVLVGIERARRQSARGSVDPWWFSVIGFIYGALYLALEFVALSVLGGGLLDTESLRTGVVV